MTQIIIQLPDWAWAVIILVMAPITIALNIWRTILEIKIRKMDHAASREEKN